jgi:hypothetical protein
MSFTECDKVREEEIGVRADIMGLKPISAEDREEKL